ncbi:AraC family transcriptional regulator [Paenibacillus sp. J5C_2022]|uniref:AraC family transcriptional regulator n=1 Tax=Paenibacillus sp. J5C2022 TaxID=2977129 RepID=UPI0021CF408A|nr:AraC family transcriptional regulator [Paenibacillus sp. J5C2022]MCU6710482.1 AraC family transcriptional regulator [Paenibacillus sp. J5C2022]
MSSSYGRHFVTTERDRGLPLHLGSVGLSTHQGAIYRENGFHNFHWLHTVAGVGEFSVNGKTVKLYPNQGILLKPNVSHSYYAETSVWSTWFMTFDGALANPITASLDLQHMQPLSWDADSPLAEIHQQFYRKCNHSFDLAGVNGSLEVYAFLTLIKQFGQAGRKPSLSEGHERLTPLYLLIEEAYGDPGLGLEQMANTLRISPQHLNALFRKSWGISPYQYLLQFRIQKSKDMLLSGNCPAVKDIAITVGFQSDSHFVYSFRRMTGMTPLQFRAHYGNG